MAKALTLALPACLLLALPALAAEGAGWRGTYDTAMRWVNFLILAAVIVKYGRAPLKAFIEAQRREVGGQIESLEKRKAELAAQIEDCRRRLEESHARLEDIKGRIIAQGEKRRREIIADAERETRQMLESARQRAEYRILAARRRLMEEIVDAAVQLALERLPSQVTAADHQRYVETLIAKAADGARA